MLRMAESTEVWQCGIGSAECAARTAFVITSRRPDMLILAGTAGARTDSGLKKGTTVLVEQENPADLGTIRNSSFHPLPKSGHDSSLNVYRNSTPLPEMFPSVVSDTVNTAGTPFREGHSHAVIENMEGAAFFAVCAALNTPYAEIRCISNYWGEDRAAWIMQQAADTLANDLSLFIEKLKRQ